MRCFKEHVFLLQEAQQGIYSHQKRQKLHTSVYLPFIRAEVYVWGKRDVGHLSANAF